MPFAAGQKLRPIADLGTGGQLPQGILRRGNRPTASATTTTTEIGVLRVDGIPIVSGRAYRIWTSPLFLYSSVTNDIVDARIRASTSGAATTASTQIGNPLRLKTDSGPGVSSPMSVIYPATVTGTLSVLLTVVRTSGTGNVQLLIGEDLIIEDVGIDPGDTGVDL